MEKQPHRPLAVLGLSFVSAGFVGIHFSSALRWILAALCALLLLSSMLPFFRKRPLSVRRFIRLLLCGLFSGLTVLSLYTSLLPDRLSHRLDQQPASITGVIREREYSTAYSAVYVLRITNGIGKRATVLLESADTSLVPGDEIRCTAKFTAFAENQGGFMQKRYYYSRGISLQAETEDLQKTGRSFTGPVQWFQQLRTLLSARLQVSLGRQDAALPAALFLGDRSQLADTLTRDMQRLGISHMLAISGQHFYLLLGAVEYALRGFLSSKKARTALLAVLCVFYMFLAGLSESVLRSGLMLLIQYGAVLLRRSSDFYSSLGLSAALICLVHPASFYSVGLQLSVASIAVLGCAVRLQKLVFSPRNTHPRVQKFVFPFILSILVQIGLLPLLCLYFGEVSLITPLAAVLFTPLVSLLLYLTPLLLLMPHLTPLAQGIRLLVQITETLAGQIAEIRGITVPMNYPLCTLFAVLLAALLFSTWFLPNRRRMMAVLCAAGCLLAGLGTYLGICTAVSASQNIVLSVQEKNNDALVVFSQGKMLLCDVSDGSFGALRSFYNEARQQHAVEVEGLLLTHLHKRHIHSFQRLQETTYVRNLILPSPANESEESIAASLSEKAAEYGIPVYYYDAADSPVIRFGEVEILPGQRTYLSRSTHPVITMQIRKDGQSVLYLGTSWNEDASIIPPASPQAVILGSHGPIYKTTADLPLNPSARILIRRESGHYAKNLSQFNTFTDTEPVVFRFHKQS